MTTQPLQPYAMSPTLSKSSFFTDEQAKLLDCNYTGENLTWTAYLALVCKGVKQINDELEFMRPDHPANKPVQRVCTFFYLVHRFRRFDSTTDAQVISQWLNRLQKISTDAQKELMSLGELTLRQKYSASVVSPTNGIHKYTDFIGVLETY